jgi:hypothetical protein
VEAARKLFTDEILRCQRMHANYDYYMRYITYDVSITMTLGIALSQQRTTAS